MYSTRDIGTLKPYPKNAKQHPSEQVNRIALSIQEFGFNQPIVVDKDSVIIVGHGRYEAAKKLELRDVPVIEVDLSEEQAKAYRLADNKLNESEWDMNLVIEELKTLSDDMIELTGFDHDLVLENDENDDVIPQNAPPKAKLGDVWALGEHKVLCGDSTDPEAVARLMGDIKADMIFTDPPYNVDYAGRGENTSNGILNDNMSNAAFDEFLGKVFKRYAEHSKSGAGWYVFHSSSTQHQFQKAITDAGWSVKNQIIWNKPVASMGWGDYRWKHEPMFYCGKENTQFYGDRTNTTVLDFQKSEQDLLNWAKRQKKAEAEGKTTIWTMKRDPVQDYVHPTQKPVELITYALKNSSKQGDVIMDLFLGSGSTLIAADKTGRVCYGMELDPKYLDVVIKRWEDYTKKEAIKL